MIVFDDGYPLAESGLAEKRAFDEILKEHPYFQVEELGGYPPPAKIFFSNAIEQEK